MRNQTSISLSSTRGAQLRELARIKGRTVADLVGGWIVKEYDALGATSEHDPCVISFDRDHDGTTIRVELFGEHDMRLSPAQAVSLASTIRAVIGGIHAALDLDAGGVIVQRRGSGLQLVSKGWSKSMAFDLAEEIAAELAEAAAEAV